jgi:NAD-dependent dihydropyrimidine dehydrogenase PreA subunit
LTVKTWKSDAVTINVDYDKCLGIGECASSCPGEVYDLIDGKAVPERIQDCIECCTCVEVCPEKAISHSSCD